MGDTPQRLSGCPDVRNMATRVVYGSVKPFEDWIAGVAFPSRILAVFCGSIDLSEPGWVDGLE
jgi:hypothetical protein